MSYRPPFRSPFSILALAALVSLLLGLYSRGSQGNRARTDLPEECEGLTIEECRARLEAMEAGSQMEPGPGEEMPEAHLTAREACVDVGYLCAELDESGSLELWRWPEETSQIRVWIPEPEGLPPGVARDLQNAAARGIRAWDGHPIPLSVRTRPTGDPPDATVRWVQSLSEDRLGRAQLEWARSGGAVRVRVVDFTLTTHGPGGGQSVLTPQQVELVAAHEMGHVLGLRHSDDTRDVMYPQNTATRLTARDYRTLASLYSMPNGVVIR